MMVPLHSNPGDSIRSCLSLKKKRKMSIYYLPGAESMLLLNLPAACEVGAVTSLVKMGIWGRE